jgi:hypothetical protein
MPERIAQYCKVHLNLQNAELSEEYYYRSLPFCIIDAVFSLAARFSSTRNAVIRFCNVEGLQRLRQHGSPYLDTGEQYSVSQLDEFLSDTDIAQIGSRNMEIREINSESGSRGFFSPGPHTTRRAGPHRAVPKVKRTVVG